MAVTLDDDDRRTLALFEDVTGVGGIDCVRLQQLLIIVVPTGEMGDAIGPGGQTVERFTDHVDTEVRLVENADDAETFVANTLTPAAVYNVTLSENHDTVAYVEVASEDRGVAIGRDGRTIDAARTLAERHFEISDIQLV
jgi:transcription termination/antitermination protein NusA